MELINDCRVLASRRSPFLQFNSFFDVFIRLAMRRPDLSPSLLSPANYDNDASSLRSPSEQDSDSDDDAFLDQNRSTLELAEHDRAVLEDEEELENLLIRRGAGHGLRRIFSPLEGSVKIGKVKKERRPRRGSRRERVSEDGELMYEMEEGIGDDNASLLSGSSLDLEDKDEYTYEPVKIYRG